MRRPLDALSFVHYIACAVIFCCALTAGGSLVASLVIYLAIFVYALAAINRKRMRSGEPIESVMVTLYQLLVLTSYGLLAFATVFIGLFAGIQVFIELVEDGELVWSFPQKLTVSMLIGLLFPWLLTVLYLRFRQTRVHQLNNSLYVRLRIGMLLGLCLVWSLVGGPSGLAQSHNQWKVEYEQKQHQKWQESMRR